MSNNNENNVEEIKYSYKVKIVIAILCTFLITFCLSVFVYDKYLSSKGLLINSSYESSGDIKADLDRVKGFLDQKYRGEINEDDMYQGAIKGFVEGLGDPYTTFLTKSELDSLNTSLNNFCGIGIYMTKEEDTGKIVIVSVIDEDTPAAKAGLKDGDIIKEVNLEDVSDKDLDYVSSKVKGEEGSVVKIKVLRGDEEKVFDVTRAKINAYKIKYEMLENNIGYIDFDSFTETSFEEFEEAYKDLKNSGAKSLIVDLRDNTGGYVKTALDILDLFIDSGKILLITEDRNGVRQEEISRTEKTIDVPVVILVNKYSASASEIMTGCLKDYGIAKIVGTNTYGKGLIQEVYDNVLGEKIGGALKVTVSEYFTPKGNTINKKGISPDEEIELDIGNDEKLTHENDNQLKKAVEILK